MKPRYQKTTVLLLAVLILALFSLLPATALATDGTPELQVLPELQTEQTPAQTLSASGASISPDTKVYYVDGRGMRRVRNFKPVRLENGLVVLWDFVEKKPYLPQSVTSPYPYRRFAVVGPDREKVTGPLIMVLR